MKKWSVVLFCAAILLLSSNAAYTKPPINDAIPHVGPVAKQPPMDDQWDLVFWYPNMTEVQFLGCEFASGCFYIAGCETPGFPEVWVFDTTGVLVFSFPQWSTGWGWRDLCYDGTYLYGSDDLVVDAFDLEGNPVPEMNINGPISPCRALAYDPNTDTFWTQSLGGPLFNFDREGTVIWTGTSGVAAAYGAAWDDFAPDGPWLWIHDMTGGCTLQQFDPEGHALTGYSYQVPLMPGLTSQMAGGLAFTEEYHPEYSVMIGLIQGVPFGGIYGLEMYPNPPPDVSISLTPYGGFPIIIPASGGIFNFNVQITNNEPDSATFDAWINVYVPGGLLFGIGPKDLTLPGGQSLSRDLTQPVPAGWPPGTYTYVGYVGFYPDAIADSSFFPFEKSAGSLVETSGAGWYTSGNSFSGRSWTAAVDEWDTLTCYPNPFNPRTMLQFSLEEGGVVDLTVFDVAGREVASLLSGYFEAGIHNVEFDGSRLASGVYICKLTTSEQKRQQKIVLMR